MRYISHEIREKEEGDKREREAAVPLGEVRLVFGYGLRNRDNDLRKMDLA